MIKRVVVTTGLKARGYVDGRYVGEEKKDARDDPRGARKVRGKAGAGGKGRGKKRGAGVGDNFGNTVNANGKKRRPQGKGRGAHAAPLGAGNDLTPGAAVPGGRGGGRSRSGTGGAASGPRQGRGAIPGKARKNGAGKRTPFRPAVGNAAAPSPSEVAEMRRFGDEARSGQFAEALAAQAIVKRERLHKVMAQSGLGSRRDMEIMISTGRVMVNGIVATTGTQVSPGDRVLVDQRPVMLKFSEELPRVLLYHKPEGEIVTTDDPGNRITVFDNLPPVANGKWMAIGRLDINTSGLLIFTTSGELANRFMHPRYEVEREYAVRILGSLTEAQEHALLTGVDINPDLQADEEIEDEDRQPMHFEDSPMGADVDSGALTVAEPPPVAHGINAPARFDSIVKRDGEESDGANQWYHVTIKEGRNREVRKMFETQGLTVSRLIRTRFGKIELPPRLTRGTMVELSPDQVKSIVSSVGLQDFFVGATPSRGQERGPRNGRGPRPQGAPGMRPQGMAPHRASGEASLDDIPDDIGNVVREPGNAMPRGPREGRPRHGRDGRRPQGGQGRQGARDGQSQGPRDPALGGEGAEGARRSRRNRRGGKNTRRGPPVNGEMNAAQSGVESGGNQSHSATHEGGASVGNQDNTGAPMSERAPRPPGQKPRGRRNFRRGGRNRRPRGEGGGEGGGNGSSSNGGGDSGGNAGGTGEGNV